MSETFSFSADVNQLMNLIINTVYSNKDIFLRELVSNASDALNKIRYTSLVDSDILGDEKTLHIQITPNKENNTLIIEDTGVGMTKEELITNLGTIAKSGTKNFIQALKKGADLSMIGQFGVGFYSSYLVADKVTVISKNNDDKQWQWQSETQNAFTISENKDENLKRGTKIILNLKEDMGNYLEEKTIKNLIQKYSEFINFPISLLVEKEVEKEVKVEKEEKVEKVEKDGEVKDEIEGEVEEEVEEEVIKVKETVYDWEHLNTTKPIWVRKPEEVEKKEYEEFYKTMCQNPWDSYLTCKHFQIEGIVDFKSILYIPDRPELDIFTNKEKLNNIKLYVQRVFIMDDCKDLMPEYFSFIKGIVDSEDLPLNMSREMLQESAVVKMIKKQLIKKVINLLNETAEDKEKYKIFWQNFSKNIKFAISEDVVNGPKIHQLLRYRSMKSEQYISLDDYIDNMKEGQEHIYYITGITIKALYKSPFLEKLRKEEVDCIYMVEAIDEYVVQKLREYKGKKLMAVNKETFSFNNEESEGYTEEDKELCDFIKKILGDNIEKVVKSNRIVKSPCCLVTSDYGWTSNMQRIMRAQVLSNDSVPMSQMTKKILEINMDHSIIKSMIRKLNKNKEDKTVQDLTWMLFDTALLDSGFMLETPQNYTHRIYSLINYGLSCNEDEEPPQKAPVVDIENLKKIVEEQLPPIDEENMEQID